MALKYARDIEKHTAQGQATSTLALTHIRVLRQTHTHTHRGNMHTHTGASIKSADLLTSVHIDRCALIGSSQRHAHTLGQGHTALAKEK